MADRILVIDPDGAYLESLVDALAAERYRVSGASDAAEAIRFVENTPVDIVLCDITMRSADGVELHRALMRRLGDRTVILTAPADAKELAGEALRRGAFAGLAKPFEASELLLVLRNAQERERASRVHRALTRDLARATGERPIVGASPAMIDLLETLERAAESDAPVLVRGEAGTGKEVLARAIHSQSPRRAASFVGLDCETEASADPDSQRAEWFGRTPRSPGERTRRGLFVEADGGTVLLDHVDALAPGMQQQLLGVLRYGAIRPVGDDTARPIDVRIIAATRGDLADAVARGRFDAELLERLAAIALEVPPLRERRKDVPLLVDHLVGELRGRLGVAARGIADDALERLVSHSWPGNIRELENALERAMLVADGDRIGIRDLPADIVNPEDGSREVDLGLKRARRGLEAEMIRRALRATGGNRTHAAKRLEISHRALLYKIKEYGIRD